MSTDKIFKLKGKKSTSKTSRNSKKKSLFYTIPKDFKKNLLYSKATHLATLQEIINILKKPRRDRSFKDIKKLSDYLTANFNYFSNLRKTNNVYQYSKTLTVLKYTEVYQGKNIVTFDEEGDRCYILLEGEVSILKPQYNAHKMTIKKYLDYLKICDLQDPSKAKSKRIIEKNCHLSMDIKELLEVPEDCLDNNEEHNIFVESFEKVFQAKDGFTFGEAALLHKQRRNATVRAEKFCKLIYIDKFDYNKVMKESEKKRIDDEINDFVNRFYLFNNWGYLSINKLYSLMTDITLDKNQILYKQNDDSEYIYFCMDGICEKYSLISLNWKNKFIDYISDFNSNFFLKVDTTQTISYLTLMRLLNQCRNNVPVSPVVSSKDFDFGKYHLSYSEQKDLTELILQKDDKFSDPYDLFKVSTNNIYNNDIIGMEEAIEFKRRFSTIKIISDHAHFKRIKTLDFFKVFINNSLSEKDYDLILDYICEKKRILVKQIELLCDYKINKHITKYIEEYNKCYNNINIKQRLKNQKMQIYINSLSKTKNKSYTTRNILARKKFKVKSLSEINLFLKSNEVENQKNELYSPQKLKLSFSNKIKSKNKFFSPKLSLYKRNLDNSEDKFIFNSPKSKFSSFSPSTKNQSIIKLKDDSNSQNNEQSLNKSLLSSSSFKPNINKRRANFIKLKKNKNFFSLSIDKSTNIDEDIIQNKKTKNIKLKDDKVPGFNLAKYKNNLYCKYGFFINEIIKLGLGPNIPLRKNMTHLNNEISMDNNINSIENLNNKKGLSLQKEMSKMRYELLKITEL